MSARSFGFTGGSAGTRGPRVTVAAVRASTWRRSRDGMTWSMAAAARAAASWLPRSAGSAAAARRPSATATAESSSSSSGGSRAPPGPSA